MIVPSLSCGIVDPPTSCSTSVEPGIVVRVSDAATDENISDRASGTIEDGDYVEELSPYQVAPDGRTRSLAGAYERPGRYAVEIRADGFETWTADAVPVWEGECHVRTVSFEARLQMNR